MTGEEARRRFSEARVARLATADGSGRPHLVPIVFAIACDTVVSAVDHKPKRSTSLKRLANVAENPSVSILVDEYSEDWDRLWWARADGTARVLDPGTVEADRAVELLAGRYPQYQTRRPGGQVLAVDVRRWSGWSAVPQGDAVRSPPR
ncbi:MAG TPA: TIGR03668 family PPOX class F420-dependent oxidoreductase [Acidimicrobiales bacterium]|nr:TIGR03668 family PPOX class F420-dependent oxidoreductase [Acidimicrobiales bacterium]